MPDLLSPLLPVGLGACAALSIIGWGWSRTAPEQRLALIRVVGQSVGLALVLALAFARALTHAAGNPFIRSVFVLFVSGTALIVATIVALKRTLQLSSAHLVSGLDAADAGLDRPAAHATRVSGRSTVFAVLGFLVGLALCIVLITLVHR